MTAKRTRTRPPTSLEFFGKLRWLDGRPLLDTVEPYRRDLFAKALDTVRADGSPMYNLVLAGRGKKNWKSADLVLAGLYCIVIRRSTQGNRGFVLAADEDQAHDDLSLAKALVRCNPALARELAPLAKELRLRDGSGSLRILPGRDAAGLHGKSFAFCGFDEIHTMRTWDALEALQGDPTRPDAVTWITTYDGLHNAPGVPLHDLKAIARAGRDPRMLCSWYSGEWCTDPAFAELEPELRANPSIGSWPEGRTYLQQQRTRLPFARYRRLHLNLPGAPEGAAFPQDVILRSVVTGRRSLPPEQGRRYVAYVDMSGGSNDDAVLCIGHREERVAVVDLVAKQIGRPPFDPRQAVAHFCRLLREDGLKRVSGDAYAGQTFRADFAREQITYDVVKSSASDVYEGFEPVLNAGELELVDCPTTIEQACSLVWRGQKITHEVGGHDDHINAVAGFVAVSGRPRGIRISAEAIENLRMRSAQYALQRRMGAPMRWPARLRM